MSAQNHQPNLLGDAAWEARLAEARAKRANSVCDPTPRIYEMGRLRGADRARDVVAPKAMPLPRAAETDEAERSTFGVAIAAAVLTFAVVGIGGALAVDRWVIPFWLGLAHGPYVPAIVADAETVAKVQPKVLQPIGMALQIQATPRPNAIRIAARQDGEADRL